MRITASTILLAAAACLLSSSTGAEAAKIGTVRRLGRNGSSADNANDGASRQPNADAAADIDNNDRRLSTGKGKGSCGGKSGKNGSGKSGKGKGSTPDDDEDDCTPTLASPTVAPSSRPSIDLDGVDECVLDAILESGWAGGKSGGKSGKNGSGKSGKGGSQARRGLAKAGSSNAEGGASRLQAGADEEHHERRLSSGKGSCGGKSGKNGGKSGKNGSGKSGSMGKVSYIIYQKRCPPTCFILMYHIHS